MGAVVQGEVVRFDQVKGYGFISPRGGGEDVFLHVNDLLDDKHLIRPGATVQFVVENGDRGLKASAVRLVSSPPPGGPVGGFREPAPVEVVRRPASASSTADPDDELVDVLSVADFGREVTEVLLTVEPSLTGRQILAVRAALTDLGTKYGWLAN